MISPKNAKSPIKHKRNIHIMREFEVVVKVQYSTAITIAAESENDAIKKIREACKNGYIMPELECNEYYDGIIDAYVV